LFSTVFGRVVMASDRNDRHIMLQKPSQGVGQISALDVARVWRVKQVARNEEQVHLLHTGELNHLLKGLP